MNASRCSDAPKAYILKQGNESLPVAETGCHESASSRCATERRIARCSADQKTPASDLRHARHYSLPSQDRQEITKPRKFPFII